MNQKKIVIASVVAALIVFTGAIVWYSMYASKNKSIANYEECAAAGYPILDSYPEQCKVPNGKTFTREVADTPDENSSPITIIGTTVCLPHKNTDGPHTLECAIGIKADNGKHYGLTKEPYDTALSEINRRVEIEGSFTSRDSKYDSLGTITVSSYTFLN